MGWIIFAVIMVVLIGRISSKAGKAKKEPKVPRVQTPQQMMAQPFVMSSGPIPPGNAPVYQPGDAPTYWGAQTYAPGGSATYAPGNPAVHQPGNPSTYAPVGAVGPVPMPLPPARQQPPALEATWLPTADGGYQPAYATATEMVTAWRDQQVVVADQRQAARTDPQQPPSAGSTAITSTALNTTLAMPYQPSSLMSSLSTTLSSSLLSSSSLGETPQRAPKTSVFEGIS